MKDRRLFLVALGVLALISLVTSGLALSAARDMSRSTAPAAPLSSAFTFQGKIHLDDQPVDVNCGMDFTLYDAPSGGNTVGPVNSRASVPVSDGYFTVPDLDFGASAFDGDARWLEITVQCQGDPGSTTLGRQALTATPYALYAAAAPWEGLSGVPAGLDDGDNVDDQVEWTEISSLVGESAMEVAEGDHTHPGADILTAVPTASLAVDALHVPWGGISGVPGYLADGDDVNDQVEWNEISSLVGENAMEVAEGDHTHPGADILTAVPTATLALQVPWPGVLNKPDLQLRVTGVCPAGSSIRQIMANGDVLCETDDDSGVSYEHVLVVAKSGGDYTTVQAAIDAATPTAHNPTLVWIAPGTYSETVTAKPHVHLQGAGQGVTILKSSASNSGSPLSEATLIITDHVSIRDLTIRNTGTLSYSFGVLGQGTASDVRMADVIVSSMGESTVSNYGIRIDADEYDLELQNVTVKALNAEAINYGMYLHGDLEVDIRGGTIQASGSAQAVALLTGGGLSDGSVTVEDTIITAQDALSTTVGVDIGDYHVLLRDCTITASGGDVYARGIYMSSAGTGTDLLAIGLTVEAADGYKNYALYTREDVTLSGGSYAASGGSDSYGVYVDEGSLHARNSRFVGDTAAIHTGSGFISGASYLAVTMLDGGVAGSGNYYCYDVYDATMSGVACP